VCTWSQGWFAWQGSTHSPPLDWAPPSLALRQQPLTCVLGPKGGSRYKADLSPPLGKAPPSLAVRQQLLTRVLGPKDGSRDKATDSTSPY
jgi:hypothetical protein